MKQIVSHHFTGMEKSENVVPTFQIVEGASDVLSFVKKHGFPCVVKPKLGMQHSPLLARQCNLL